MGRRDDSNVGVAERMEGMKAEYQAAKSSRFKRRRTGMLLTGSGADYHYRNVFDYLRVIEYARDMDRNDAIVGQMINRAVLNTIQNGFAPDPKTGDTGLNQELFNRWNAWANDPQQCDLAGEKNFTDLEELAFRSVLVDGDCFVLPTDDGPLQFLEAHRARTPTGTKRKLVCGVLLDDQRRRVEYWFTKDDVDPWVPVLLVGDVDRVAAFHTDPETGAKYPNVLHVYDPKRYTQTRGMSALTPIFDLVGMHEDLHFAKLVQQQVASCIAIIRQREKDFKPQAIDPYGKQTTEYLDAQKRIVEEMAPGMEIRGLPGETVTGFSPNIPNAEFFQQMRTVLQLIGINLGLPLVLLLMDASDTNFSGWRGAVDQARAGFRRNQRWLMDHFHTPLWVWKLRQFIRSDPKLRAKARELGSAFFSHQWNAPRWPYIQPLQDAQADQLRQNALLASPRRIHAERSQDWEDIIAETVEDNAHAIAAAIEARNKLNAQYQTDIHWREVLFLTDVDTLNAIKPGTPPADAKPMIPPTTPRKGDDDE